MSKRKGMSLEDKRKTILGIYHRTKDVYNLKEIESDASKAGVVQQSVKDVNQELVNDGLVETDKIGAGNFFWSFPGKALIQAKTQCQTAENDIIRIKAEVGELEKKVQGLQAGRVESKERQEMLRKYQEEQDKKARLLADLKVFKDNDPELVTKTHALIEECKKGVNRWTDNTYSLKSFMVKKCNKLPKEVDRFLKMDENFDMVS